MVSRRNRLELSHYPCPGCPVQPDQRDHVNICVDDSNTLVGTFHIVDVADRSS